VANNSPVPGANGDAAQLVERRVLFVPRAVARALVRRILPDGIGLVNLAAPPTVCKGSRDRRQIRSFEERASPRMLGRLIN
jgi:hypothetical protein